MAPNRQTLIKPNVARVVLTLRRPLPVSPEQWTSSDTAG